MKFSKAHLNKLRSILQKDYGVSFDDVELRMIAEQLSRMVYVAQTNLNKKLQNM